ncbi:MAG: hypothetical protein NTW17_02120 [Candidatus Pacearchaeota archaeon]|nr:hypothetical protein [Candidatus Pacearchaeota archaeon]
MKLIYTAYPEEYAYFRSHIFKYVLEHKCVPLGPMDDWLSGFIKNSVLENASLDLVSRCDGLWVFGNPADEISGIMRVAEELNKPIKRFLIIDSKEIREEK